MQFGQMFSIAVMTFLPPLSNLYNFVALEPCGLWICSWIYDAWQLPAQGL